MNKYIIQNDESGKQWAVGPVLKIKPFLSAYIDSKGRISDRYEFDMDDWFSYLIQLPRFEWQGAKREVGDVVVENVDFWFGEGRVIKGRERAQVAIPLSKAEEVKEKEDGWISVEDKVKPPKSHSAKYSIDVLCWMPFPNNFCIKGMYCFMDSSWLDIHGDEISPTHWQPLPPPPPNPKPIYLRDKNNYI